MTLWWMGYVLLTGVPIVAATWLVASQLRRRNRGERGVWLAGLIGAIALPAVLIAWGALSTSSPGLPDGPVAVLPGLEIAPTFIASAGTPSTTGVAVALWVLLSGGMVVWLALSTFTLFGLRSSARREVVEGRFVRVSDDVGPAVVGFVRPEIIVPAWVLELSPSEQEWVLRHEEEHVRARDPILLLIIQLARALVPWHPAVWFLGARLRQGIEIDCDRRVLRRRPEPHAYGHMLLHALVRQSHPLPIAAAFSFRRHDLEQRISTMTRPRRSLGFTGLVTLLGGVGLVVAACVVPLPTNADRNEMDTAERADAVTSGADDAVDGPRFTPFTVAPDLTNRTVVQEALVEAYPDELRDAGIGGAADVWLFVSDEGRVVEVRLNESSGHPAIDEAALSVARQMEFSPALNRDQPVEVWVRFPISFQTPTPGSVPAAPPSDEDSDEGNEGTDAPAARAYAAPPRLVDADAVSERLQEEYPPLLRGAGIGGRAAVQVYIDEEGRVQDTRIDESSGHQALDEASLRVARTMRFEPAYDADGAAVAVWIEVPLTFQIR